jgi:hypothetical protein
MGISHLVSAAQDRHAAVTIEQAGQLALFNG